MEGWVEKRNAQNIHLGSNQPARPQYSLTDEQADAVRAIAAGFGSYSPWLLEGITGSGKTEVYFRLIEEAADRDLQVIEREDR